MTKQELINAGLSSFQAEYALVLIRLGHTFAQAIEEAKRLTE